MPAVALAATRPVDGESGPVIPTLAHLHGFLLGVTQISAFSQDEWKQLRPKRTGARAYLERKHEAGESHKDAIRYSRGALPEWSTSVSSRTTRGFP
jgi:hypothetical protein